MIGPHQLERRELNASLRGYTLIEMILSVVILMALMLGLLHAFDRGSSAWENGTRMAQQNLTGRVVMDIMSVELSESVAGGTNYLFNLTQNEVTFYTLNAKNDIAGYFQAREIRYHVDEGILIRTETATSPNASQGPQVTTRKMCNGVQQLKFSQVGSISETMLPQYVDIYLEVRTDSDTMSGDLSAGSNAGRYDRSYAVRTYLMNRERYLHE